MSYVDKNGFLLIATRSRRSIEREASKKDWKDIMMVIGLLKAKQLFKKE